MAVSLATLCTRRRESGVTSAPIRTRNVAQATAARATHGSATARTGAVGDVIPGEEAIPAPLLGPGSQASRHPRVGQLPEQPDIDRALHDGDLSYSPGT